MTHSNSGLRMEIKINKNRLTRVGFGTGKVC